MEFKDKVVLITGAAGGIGKTTVRAFYDQGANLALVDLHQNALEVLAADLELSAERVLLIAGDVSQEGDVQRYVQATTERFGRIDIFFNNAGIEGKPGSLVETDAATLDAILDVNVKGSFFGIKHVLGVMLEQKAGSIVNTSSMAGLIGFPALGVYTASKHAVIGLTRVAAQESAHAGIRVNAVCPGPVNTRMMRGIEAGLSTDTESIKSQFASLVGLKRYAEPEEITQVVLFLASDRASYVTGSIYTADGGMTGM
ncbi:SDR family NAD(P)-dependent oxidoreductase [Variovorax ginsengisoli]|uniref:NAD(P)-dependent dehydrogenase (Short-subunit alcohol dehydrogenase family) n=1 Tax=Variovorax ginsengisoli TaxID=363844 RepID=A0ABT9SBM8_9BURK|nr:SDR family oxidoreductase [Variovorax ginsengisoli]MDP9901752.1 NAD(P)-dependent dehydrogenase (short-subunit alcohol dehydrogenase family) [Variovorax ginsengisoli]